MPDVKQHTCSLNDTTTTYIFNEKNMYKERKGFKLSQKLMQDGNGKKLKKIMILDIIFNKDTFTSTDYFLLYFFYETQL